MLSAIERATRQKIEQLELPSTEMVNNKRIAAFKQTITDTLGAGQLDYLRTVMEQYQQEHDIPALEIAAALAKMAIGDRDLLITDKPTHTRPERDDKPDSRARPNDRPGRTARSSEARPPRRARDSKPPEGLERYRIEVGHQHEVKPGNIVGAIANEAGLDAAHIGHIDIHDEFSYVDLPSGMPADIFHDLKKVRVCGHAMKITRTNEDSTAAVTRAKPRVETGKTPRAEKPRSDQPRAAKPEPEVMAPTEPAAPQEKPKPTRAKKITAEVVETQEARPVKAKHAKPVPTEGMGPVKKKARVVKKSNADTKIKAEKSSKPSRKARKQAKTN